jgi:hypothetical protein
MARKIRIRDIEYSHEPRKAGKRSDKYADKPIEVRPKFWGGYRVVDGNDRLYYAEQDGQTHINATLSNCNHTTRLVRPIFSSDYYECTKCKERF